MSDMTNRRFNAIGGYNSFFMAIIFGFASNHFGLVKAPVLGNAGFVSLARSFAVLAAPSFVGFIFGLNTFGQPRELWNLVRNGG